MRTDPLYFTHVQLTLVLAGWAVLLALPGDMLVGPGYRMFETIAAEPWWTILFGAAALIGAAGLLEQQRRWRRYSVQVLSFTHTIIAIMIGWGHISPGAWTYAVIALSAGYLAWADA